VTRRKKLHSRLTFRRGILKSMKAADVSALTDIFFFFFFYPLTQTLLCHAGSKRNVDEAASTSVIAARIFR